MEIATDSPKYNEIEISCFGPGFGESIIIHLGNNEWAIIDSCLNFKESIPISIQYLKNLKVNLASQVKIVLATHWHDDHIRGIADTLEKCENAKFCCADALKPKEFLDLITAYGESSYLEDSGVSELYKVTKILKKRKKKNRTPTFVSENKRIWFKPAKDSVFNLNIEIFALSPSDAAKLMTLETIGSLLPKDFSRYTTKQRIPDPKPNDVSIVLWLSIGDKHFLFGSDLENNVNEELGWKAVIKNTKDTFGKALYYKIAHHGSESSHNNHVWENLLEKNPLACLSPFRRGKNKIPTKQDVDRILSFTPNAYSTASFQRSTRIRRQTAVERTIKNITLSPVELLFPPFGQVRVRLKSDSLDNPKVDLFQNAVNLKDIYGKCS